jgi:hypothetical protein
MNADGAFAPRVRGAICPPWLWFKDSLEPTHPAGYATAMRPLGTTCRKREFDGQMKARHAYLFEPSLPSIACGWLPAHVFCPWPGGESHRRVTPFRVSIFRDHRATLYAVSLFTEWMPRPRILRGRLETIPFPGTARHGKCWACLSFALAGSN